MPCGVDVDEVNSKAVWGGGVVRQVTLCGVGEVNSNAVWGVVV